MDNLPELAFEKVLSYLSLEDRLKSSAVSRGWQWMIDQSKVKSLCCSSRPPGFIVGKKRLITDVFAQNFISSMQTDLFFSTYGPSILSNVKHLRFCDLDLYKIEIFEQTLNSFRQLEELDLIGFRAHPATMLDLNLQMLHSLQLENVHANLRLETPRLRNLQLAAGDRLSLELVHNQSIERLLTGNIECSAVKNLSLGNLKYFYVGYNSGIHPTLLSDLDQLKEIHLTGYVDNLFEQKKLYGRASLKIYLRGLLLDGPDDPTITSASLYVNEDLLVQLAENQSRLADEIPLLYSLRYSQIERVDRHLLIDLLRRFTDLKRLVIDRPIQNIQRFLDLLKNFQNIEFLRFYCDQPQDLFDQLPEHCDVQELSIHCTLSDFEFLSRMKHVINLEIYSCSIDVELVRKLFKDLPFLLNFKFKFNNKFSEIGIARNSGWSHPKRFQVGYGNGEVPDLEAAIQFIFGMESGQLS